MLLHNPEGITKKLNRDINISKTASHQNSFSHPAGATSNAHSRDSCSGNNTKNILLPKAIGRCCPSPRCRKRPLRSWRNYCLSCTCSFLRYLPQPPSHSRLHRSLTEENQQRIPEARERLTGSVSYQQHGTTTKLESLHDLKLGLYSAGLGYAQCTHSISAKTSQI